jgi:hypothetical protein
MAQQASGSSMKQDGQGSGQPPEQSARDKRQDRLKLALRENLKRRKSQARERSDFTPAPASSDEVARDGGEEAPGK